MSAGAFPKPSLRPYQESDLESLAEIRFAAIVSDTAKPLFEARGYRAEHRHTIEIDGQWLGNTRMKKLLAPKVT